MTDFGILLGEKMRQERHSVDLATRKAQSGVERSILGWFQAVSGNCSVPIWPCVENFEAKYTLLPLWLRR